MSAFGATGDDDVARVFTAQTQRAFDDQSAAIRVQLGGGGRYEFATADERRTIDRRFDEIASILARYDADGPIANDDKVALYVAQEDVNAILTRRDGRRVVCQSVTIPGSHRKQRQCATYAERESERRDSEKYLRETNRKSVCLKCGEPEVWGGNRGVR
ncbi:MAG TPA: hypothetical protein VJ696_10535 [Rhodanobacteraceae bacterium]|nr:hypothetical protein [Rhodanobacteraceae bacterium]